ncbi:hypothetical protein H257_14080 [Aphanomyces astaci]|uniref:Helicase-associated domain-containing protein n=2 Tax=Aphanomyces astaci TaxID=112090 RepID=W4FSF2_APHAT|nr:hypothetical protein H257_14080 [Aphanomyces astaci]ETV70402.1 hypothetical protein H257_14080 [Aphanomyces astaci]|eukprot:XP_009840114.1 hypothetical protein H257_14080 [Aphanomyces astaci]
MSAAMTMLGGLLRRQGVRSMSSWKKAPFSVKDQELLLQVVQSVHETQGAGANLTSVLSTFVVPAEAAFPKELHGVKFPLEDLRSQYCLERLDGWVAQELDTYGIVWVPEVVQPKKWTKKARKAAAGNKETVLQE